MLKNYLSRSCYTASSNFPLQSCIAKELQHHWCFVARSHANAFSHSRLQIGIAGATRQIDRRLRSADKGDDSVPLQAWGSLRFFLQDGALATVLCAFGQLHLPKMLRTHQIFNVQIEPCSPVRFLSATFPNRVADLRKHTPYFGNPRNHIAWKNVGPESVFTHEFTRFRTLTLPSYLVTGLTWWCGWHEGVNANHDHRP